MLTLGSLFDGIAGFPLAASLVGIKPIWASEIEPFPIAVSKAHFPGMKHLGSVTDINGAEIEPVDIITFGSPCQDLSVAGKRSGLDGERSNLFYEAVRIIREMQRATANEYPRYAVWENVPGAFSSNEGRDFACVIGSLVGAELSVPEDGWTSAGVAFGPAGQVAWRILDAQYWGVPQRRRRIFLIYDPRNERAGEILFVDQGVPGNPPQGREAGEGTAEGAGDGVETTGSIIAFNGRQDPMYGKVAGALDTDRATQCIAQCVTTGTGRRYDPETETLVPVQLYDMTHAEEVMRPVTPGLSPTLNARMGTGGNQIPVLMEPTYAFSAGQSDKARSLGFQEEISPTLRAGASGTNMTPTVLAFGHKDFGGDAGSVAPILRAMSSVNSNPAGGGNVAVAYDPKDLGRRPATFEGVSPTIKARCGTGGNNILITKIGYAVRRLTPLECERLQGFPDNWTNIKGASDTARYKALGNSVAIPCVKWIMRRIAEVATCQNQT